MSILRSRVAATCFCYVFDVHHVCGRACSVRRLASSHRAHPRGATGVFRRVQTRSRVAATFRCDRDAVPLRARFIKALVRLENHREALVILENDR